MIYFFLKNEIKFKIKVYEKNIDNIININHIDIQIEKQVKAYKLLGKENKNILIVMFMLI
jgi:hypothetical protein